MYRAKAIEVLGLDPDKTDYNMREIRHAFRRKCLKAHPDKGGTEAQFQEVQEAYQFMTGGDSDIDETGEFDYMNILILILRSQWANYIYDRVEKLERSQFTEVCMKIKKAIAIVRNIDRPIKVIRLPLSNFISGGRVTLPDHDAGLRIAYGDIVSGDRVFRFRVREDDVGGDVTVDDMGDVGIHHRLTWKELEDYGDITVKITDSFCLDISLVEADPLANDMKYVLSGMGIWCYRGEGEVMRGDINVRFTVESPKKVVSS